MCTYMGADINCVFPVVSNANFANPIAFRVSGSFFCIFGHLHNDPYVRSLFRSIALHI